MDFFTLSFSILGAVISLLIILVFINIIQNGRVLPKKSLPELQSIVGKSRENVTAKDLLKLSKKEVFQVFQQLPPVDLNNLEGDYQAFNLPQAALSGVISFITDHLFGPGRWVGKGFSSAGSQIEGYNIFQHMKKNTKIDRPFTVYQTSSEIDGRPTTRFDYRNMNHDLVAGSMRDEVREVNNRLLLGMGITSWGLGRINPAHFILIGKNN